MVTLFKKVNKEQLFDFTRYGPSEGLRGWGELDLIGLCECATGEFHNVPEVKIHESIGFRIYRVLTK